MPVEDGSTEKPKFGITPPSISLPKGGGAIRGIGEKFAANPVMGTGTLSVPIATSPGRGGFGPRLSLNYDSSASGGPFGLGWNLPHAAITRKTDKGLPQYYNAEESDVFLLSSAEDLVPVLAKTAAGNWESQSIPPRVVGGVTYLIRAYCPRTEGLFARIERWTNRDRDTDSFWRSISPDNVTTWYGRTDESRITDPTDSSKIFSWLICETHDDKGNVTVYRYRGEDSDGVDELQLHERNRDDTTRSANRYLKRILYGNHRPYLPRLLPTQPWPEPPGSTVEDASGDWFFETVFDYGEHDTSAPTPTDTGTWTPRQDPFSSYRAGFEIRTYRLCKRVLMFHHFRNDPNVGLNCLVRSTDFTYSYEQHPGDPRNPIHSTLRRVWQRSYKRKTAVYMERSLPPLDLEYTLATIDETVRQADPASLENIPSGMADPTYQWVDLDGEGLSGLLTEQGGAWFYKRNISALPVAINGGAPVVAARFAPLECVRSIPSKRNLAGGDHLLDLTGDGHLDLVALDDPVPGYFERTQSDDWENFTPFESVPNISWQDPNLRFVDLTGDGTADVLVTEDEALTWYPSLGERGFDSQVMVRQALDEETGPRLVFLDGTQSIYLSDFSGDGLSDLVRIRNGEVSYWPNLGYGRFGAKIIMTASPWFDAPDQFDQKRIRLADVDGSGTADIIYLGHDGIDVYFNCSGNSWSARRTLETFPHVDDLSQVTAVDLLGNGTACLVWSSSLITDARHQLRYIDLMGGEKPHLLVRVKNNLGAETEVKYAPSTKFYLADKLAGKPWITRLPFPVHVVETVIARDKWRNTTFTSSYSYHHGYFDGVEREFRGFGRVEHVDIQSYHRFAAANASSPYVAMDLTLYQPPVKTISWFHTGAFIERERILSQFKEEYFPTWFAAQQPYTDVENALQEPDLEGEDLSVEEWREALRACRGMLLRQEAYELDVDALHELGQHIPVTLYSAAYHNCHIRLLQHQAMNRHAVFLVTESEALTYTYELDLRKADAAPDPRISHTINLTTDKYGNVNQAIAVAYPRIGTHDDNTLTASQRALIREVQGATHLTYVETRHTNDVPETAADKDNYRLRVPYEAKTYELTGIAPAAANGYFTLAELRNYLLSSDLQPPPPLGSGPGHKQISEIPYHDLPGGGAQKRLIENVRTLYFRDGLQGFLPLGKLGALGLTYEAYKLALTDDLLDAVFGTKLHDVVDGGDSAADKLNDESISGYLRGAQLVSRFSPRIPAASLGGQYWIRSGIAGFATDAAQHFYLPQEYTDPFGAVTSVQFDGNDLFIESATDVLGNTSSVEAFDFRVLAPRELRDRNDNLTEVVFDVLGMVIAAAVKGKGTEGDNLAGFTTSIVNPSPSAVAAFCGSATLDTATARSWLRGATTRFVYHFGETRDARENVVAWETRPAGACGILREIHAAALGGANSPLQVALECSDGGGGVLMKKSQAEPTQVGGALRWIVSGKTVLNNKGKAVKQYEPYFSKDFGSEAVDEVGVTPLMYYDAVGRLVRNESPDGTLTRVEFSPWYVATFDPNDTVSDPDNAWYARNSATTASVEERRAAAMALGQALSPSITVVDSLGRDVVAVSQNKYVDTSGDVHDERYFSYTRLDTEGKALWKRDPRRNLVVQYIQPPMPEGRATDATTGFVPCYDVAGNLLFEHSMDAGEKWTLTAAAGRPMIAWASNERQDDSGVVLNEERVVFSEYDLLHRPVRHWLTINGGTPQEVERFVYGETVAGAKGRNIRGQLYRHYEGSGRLQIEQIDFKGNQIEVRRRLAKEFRAATIDWQATPDAKLEAESFVQITEYDALSRMTRQYNWHRGTGSRVAVYLPNYNERGLLASEDIVVRAAKTAGGYIADAAYPIRKAIKAIVYDAKGQRQLVHYGNDTRTRYNYDPLTFRLVQLRTTRPGFNPAFPNQPASLVDSQILQNLFYIYDPFGNITAVRDDAYEPAFFQNQQVNALNRYTYDGLYRLIGATGRESVQNAGAPVPTEGPSLSVQFPLTNKTLRNYSQEYDYDAVGNITEMRHRVTGTGSWTRHYQYASYNNHLTRTWQGNSIAAATQYQYDARGNVLNLLNVAPAQRIRWDYRDMIRALDLQGGGRMYYNYHSSNKRSRQVNANTTGPKYWERIYLDGLEIYRRYSGPNVVEEIESLHLVDGKQRILLLEDVLQTDNANLPTGPLFRFQYGNYLNSTALEADEQGAIISYEEFHPYGTSAYRAKDSAIEIPPTRYRYTGMQRDGESGLYYHGARYYAPWLARWTSCDPSGTAEGPNLYAYVKGNPCILRDPTGTVGEPSQLELIQQSELRQPVTATAATPGFGQTLRGIMQALGTQWGWESTDVGHPEDKPFAMTPAGTTTSVYPQPSAENQLLGGTLEKAKIAEARAAGQAVRKGGAWPGATKGVRYGQPALRPKLEGVRVNDPVPAPPPEDVAPPSTGAAPKPAAGPPPEQLELSLTSPQATAKSVPATLPSAKSTAPAAVAPALPIEEAPPTAPAASPASAPAPSSGLSVKGAITGVGVGVAAIGLPILAGSVAQLFFTTQKAKEAASTIASMVTQAGVEWVFLVGPTMALAGAKFILPYLAMQAGAAATATGAAVGTAFGASSLGAIAAGGAAPVAVAVAAVAAAGAVGYAVGTGLNKLFVEKLIDKAAPGSGALGDWYYKHFLK